MLNLISTPIGNLNDISLRAIDVLNKADYIYAEDTRNTNKLLNTFIKKYSNKPKFKYQTNNPLYGNTNVENDVKLFANYIKTIVNK